MLSVSYEGFSGWDASVPATLVWGDSSSQSERPQDQDPNEPAHIAWYSDQGVREDILQQQPMPQDPVPAPSNIPTHLIWCDELYRREERQEIDDIITEFGNKNGLTILRFRKAYHYSSWLSQSETGTAPPHLLLTDWREFKPCNIFLETEKPENFPVATILFIAGVKAVRSAHKAVREARRQQASRKFLIVQDDAELVLELEKMLPPTRKEAHSAPQPAFIEHSVPYPRFIERPTSWQF